MSKISDENLDILIAGLQEYKNQGVYDPWFLSNGSAIQPLDALEELKELRVKVAKLQESIKNVTNRIASGETEIIEAIKAIFGETK